MALLNLLILLASFIVLWFSASLAVTSTSKLAKQIKMSSFAVSFFILGLLTSVTEFALGLNSVLAGDPKIFVGNLIGASIVIFSLIIPLFAILGKGIKLNHEITKKSLILTSLVIIAPSVVLFDKNVTLVEGVILIFLYVFLLFQIEHSQNLVEQMEAFTDRRKNQILKQIMFIVVGVILVLITSHQIVDQTIYFSKLLKVSDFIISLLFLSIGTNIPEMTLAITSLVNKKKDIAFGDYLGSAAANTLIFGILAVLNQKTITIENNFFISFGFTALALILFFVFSRSKNDISRKEGFVILAGYIGFVVAQTLSVI